MRDEEKTREELLAELIQLRRQVAAIPPNDDTKRLFSFPQQNPDPVFEIDLTGTVTYMNPVAQQRFAELPETGFAHPLFAGLEALINRFGRGDQGAYVREARIGDFIYEQKMTRVPDQPLLRIYAHDITARKQMEEALHQSESKYRRVIEGLEREFFFFSQDIDETITFARPSMASVLGYTDAEFEALDFSQLSPDTPLNRKAAVIRERIRAGELLPPYNFEMLHKDGTLHRFEVTRLPVYDENGQVTGTEGIVRDDTERYRTAEALKRTQAAMDKAQKERIEQLQEQLHTAEQLRQAQQQLIAQEKMASLGKLVAGLTHELNSPLGVLRSAVDTVRRCADKITRSLETDPSLQEVLADRQFRNALTLLYSSSQNAASGSERINKLVESLKNFARLDEAEYQMVDLHEGIDSALTLLEPQLGDRIIVEKSYGQIPPLYCAPAQLNQVFMHLLQNAAQAIDKQGRIAIKTYQDQETLILKISDTGVGIPPDQLNRIFDFEFANRGARMKMGFGLSVDHTIIKRHQGEMDIESTVGQGTTVTIRLPIKDNDT